MQNPYDPETLWVKNRHRITTTDAFNLDWFYCKAGSNPLFPNPTHPYKTGINRDYINKETTDCEDVDRIGIIRPVFKDRLCDGFVDCFDQSDEESLGNCELDKTMHPYDSRCYHSLMATHKLIDNCTAFGQHNEKPLYKCWQNFDYDNERRIFWTNSLSENAWIVVCDKNNISPNLCVNQTAGWVLSDELFEDKKLIAFHPATGNKTVDACPPTGQWKIANPHLYKRAFTYPKRIGVEMPVLNENVTVCGDPTGRFNRTYEKDENNVYVYKFIGQSDGGNIADGGYGETHIYFQKKNMIWVIYKYFYGYNTYTKDRGNFHSLEMVDKTFNLIGTHWAMATADGVRLPGDTFSRSYEWKHAPTSFIAVKGSVTCPYVGPLPDELFVCGSKYWVINGRYELQSDLINGFPYFLFVGELTQPASNIVIFWHQKSNNWLINDNGKNNDDLENPTAWYKKTGDFNNLREKSHWMVSQHKPILPDFQDDSSGVDINEWILAPEISIATEYEDCSYELADEIYVCGAEDNWSVDGKYKLKYRDLVNGLPYYQYVGDINEPGSTLVIYWEPISGSWIINRDLKKEFGWYHKIGLDLQTGVWMVADTSLYIPGSNLTQIIIMCQN